MPVNFKLHKLYHRLLWNFKRQYYFHHTLQSAIEGDSFPSSQTSKDRWLILIYNHASHLVMINARLFLLPLSSRHPDRSRFPAGTVEWHPWKCAWRPPHRLGWSKKEPVGGDQGGLLQQGWSHTQAAPSKHHPGYGSVTISFSCLNADATNTPDISFKQPVGPRSWCKAYLSSVGKELKYVVHECFILEMLWKTVSRI